MSAATISALATACVAIITAITGLVHSINTRKQQKGKTP